MIEFKRGDSVEVMGKEEGFEGSYYEAIIVTKLKNQEYIVTYRTLLDEDLSRPLREVVAAADLRPPPPDIAMTEFRSQTPVDAFYNDGWWAGKIVGRRSTDSSYNVRFENTRDEFAYKIGDLRVHQDWINGKWIAPNCRKRR